MLLLIQKHSFRIKAPNSVNASKRKHINQINHYNKQRRVLMTNYTVCESKWKPIVEPRRAKGVTLGSCCSTSFFWTTVCSIVMKTCLYNVYPLKPHFYVIKLGFKVVYIIFLILLKNIDCGYSLEQSRLKIFILWCWNFQYIWIGLFS